MTVTLEKPTSAWLANELDGNHRPSRENVVIAASQTLVDGAVVSLNATGQIQAFTAAAAVEASGDDPAVPREVAIGVYVGESVITGAAATAEGVIVARTAKVVAENLTWGAALEAADIAAGLADLAAKDITTVRSA